MTAGLQFEAYTRGMLLVRQLEVVQIRSMAQWESKTLCGGDVIEVVDSEYVVHRSVP